MRRPTGTVVLAGAVLLAGGCGTVRNVVGAPFCGGGECEVYGGVKGYLPKAEDVGKLDVLPDLQGRAPWDRPLNRGTLIPELDRVADSVVYVGGYVIGYPLLIALAVADFPLTVVGDTLTLPSRSARLGSGRRPRRRPNR